MKHGWLSLLLIVMLGLTACSSSSVLRGKEQTDEEKAAATYAELGLGYLRQGNLEMALTKLKRALEIDDDNPEANHYIAEVYNKLGEKALAERHYRRAVRLSPNNPMVQNNFGAFLCKEGKLAEAEEYLLRSVTESRNRNPALVYENIGLCAYRGGERNKAEEYFRKALDKQPELAKSLYYMAVLSYDKKDYLRARAFIQRYEAVTNHVPQSLRLAARIEQAMGDQNAADKYLATLRQNFPNANDESDLTTEGQ